MARTGKVRIPVIANLAPPRRTGLAWPGPLNSGGVWAALVAASCCVLAFTPTDRDKDATVLCLWHAFTRTHGTSCCCARSYLLSLAGLIGVPVTVYALVRWAGRVWFGWRVPPVGSVGRVCVAYAAGARRLYATVLYHPFRSAAVPSQHWAPAVDQPQDVAARSATSGTVLPTTIPELPHDVAALLSSLSAACGDASVADAQARLTRARQPNRDGNAPSDHPATAALPLPTTTTYLAAAARFAAASVQVLSRLVDGRPVTVAEITAISAFDVLSTPELHTPPVQIPIGSIQSTGHGVLLAAANRALSQDHSRLARSLGKRGLDLPAGPSAVPGPADNTAGNRADDPDCRLARDLHDYASTCLWAAALLR
jgi:hypothetical protein